MVTTRSLSLARLRTTVLTLLLAAGPRPAGATSPEPPPCVDATCAQDCAASAAALTRPDAQSFKPPQTGTPTCVEVSLPVPGRPCELEKHAVCDCTAPPVASGTSVSRTGLPAWGVVGDAPAGACVRKSWLLDACLLTGEQARCTVGGDGTDCRAACELWRSRVDAEAQRAAQVKVDGARCADATACGCVLELQGQCAVGDHGVACGTDPKIAYEAWLQAARDEARNSLCNAGGCALAAPGGARDPAPGRSTAIPAALAALSLLALGRRLLAVRRRYPQ